MRKEDFILILDKGVAYWNQWRRENPKVIPDLSKCEISDTRPAFPKEGVEYKKRNLEGINFQFVDLSQSTLRGVNLRKANLTHCNFYRADLRKANLSLCDLSNAKLNLANLTLANLKRATLSGTLFWETNMSRTNFNGATGLESCKHGGPSLIDIKTIHKSNGLPDSFLKGIGLPQDLAKMMNNVKRNFFSCFISYSHKDEEFVLKLWNDLQNSGVRCWYAPESLDIGDKFREKIEDAIQSFDKLIIVLSKNSIASGWVEDEIETVMEKEYGMHEPLVLPIRLDNSIWESHKAWSKKIGRSRNIGDFSDWSNPSSYQVSFHKLLKAIMR